MNELNQISDVNQIVNNIKEEITRSEPSSARIITHLYDLRTKEEYQSLSDSEFYNIVGETFKLNPEFYMKYIYGARELYAKVNNREMEKYILEKFCLYEGEQILYECNGKLKESNPSMKVVSTVVKASVNGTIYVTNYRIIAQGKLGASGGRWWGGGLLDLALAGMTGHGKRAKSKTGIIEGSISQELPCYGYQFKTKNHVRLKRKSNGILYSVIVDKVENISNMSRSKQFKAVVQAMRLVRITLPYTNKEEINNIFEILCKNVNHTIDSFLEMYEIGLTEKLKRGEFLYRLRKLWNSEEYKHLSDSEYLDIVKAVYNIDPEFFMTSIYPKMRSWNFPLFLRVKEEVFEILSKEGGNIQ